MSTKIYNGYRIKAQSLDEAIEKLFLQKPQALQDIEKKAMEDFLVKVLTVYEDHTLRCIRQNPEELENFKKEEQNNALFNASSREMEKIWNKEDVDTEIALNIVLYPQKCYENGQSFYLFTEYTPGGNFSGWLESHMSEVEEYAYFNNTDKPDELTDEQWGKRHDDWALALLGEGKTGVPKIEGLSVVIAEKKLPYYFHVKEKGQEATEILAKIAEKMPLEKRIRNYVKNFATNLILREKINQMKEEGIEEKEINNCIFSLVSDAQDEYREGNYNEYFKIQTIEMEKNIRKGLKAHITLEDLQKPFFEISAEIQTRLNSNTNSGIAHRSQPK